MDVQTWQRRGTIAEHRGWPIFVVDDDPGGTALPVVCIHGYPTASYDWHRVWDGLAQRRRVVAPDLLGFGFSAKPRRHRYRIGEQADLVEDVLDRLGITAAHVLAHDYGDTVAQELLARAHERDDSDTGLRPRGVVLLNGGLFPETHRPVLGQRLLLSPLGPLLSHLVTRDRFLRGFRVVLSEPHRRDSELLEQLWQLVSADGGERLAHRLLHYVGEREDHRERWVGALQSTRSPLRLVAGLADPVSGEHMVRRYHELVPEPDVVELADVGHYPQLERPDAVLRAVEEHLERAEQTG